MNDKEVKDMLQEDRIPERLEPANIKAMLDEKAAVKNRSKISVASRFAAIAAACAVVSGTAVYFANKGNNIDKKSQEAVLVENGTDAQETKLQGSSQNTTEPASSPDGETLNEQKAYMRGASDYGEVYRLFAEAAKKAQKRNARFTGLKTEYAEEVDGDMSAAAENSNEDIVVPGGMGGGGDEGHSETYDQEAGVREADIVKTDGKNIYFVNNAYKEMDNGIGYYYYSKPCAQLHITSVDKGNISRDMVIDINSDIKANLPLNANAECRPTVQDMYLYNDMAIVIVSVEESSLDEYGNYYGGYYRGRNKTAVLAYSVDDDHRLLGCYYQSGSYNDVRIAPDGYMYLISQHDTQSFSKITDEESIEKYIPCYGLSKEPVYLEAEDILLPDGDFTETDVLSYTIIGSIDLNETGKLTPANEKALASYAGAIYCSHDNLYTSAYDYMEDLPENPPFGTVIKTSEHTDITRIAISGGNIEPAAATTIEGRVNDQFSMSEYNGTFRVASTCSNYTMTYTKYEDYIIEDMIAEDYNETVVDTTEASSEDDEEEYGYYRYDFENEQQDNRLYVLDLDLNMIGKVEGFGKDESVKSVNFNGDMAYVVTYEQTDPLFAIDLSTPEEPKILDEYKMLGYSSYMQRWSDDLLFGFGPDADMNGRVVGVKMVMFDNSDPNDLKQVGKVAFDKTADNEYISSEGTYDRKALLIDPEKNIIAFPLHKVNYNYDDYEGSNYSYDDRFVFYKYENGGFVHIGDIVNNYMSDENYVNMLRRAVYIGDYVYVIGAGGITAADINDFNVTSTIKF